MTTTEVPGLIADDDLSQAVRAFVSARASSVDACEASPRETIAYLSTLGVLDRGVLGLDAPQRFLEMCRVIGTVALDCMSQAFSIWCHRMAIEYLQLGAVADRAREQYLEGLRSGAILGSTSFASASAHYLAGTPLPLSFRETPDGLVVNGRITWASNLEAPFVSVAAAVNEDDPADRRVFLYHESTPGLELSPYPQLLALQATNSTSPAFVDALIPHGDVLAREFSKFVERVLATFLLLQSSFCWGLATRAQSEAASELDGPREVFAPRYDELQARLRSAEAQLRAFALDDHREEIAHRDLLQLRLDFGRLACDSVALEAKLVGGRGYMLHSSTARRLREAAFLPVQAPTEVQLQWLLTRSA